MEKSLNVTTGSSDIFHQTGDQNEDTYISEFEVTSEEDYDDILEAELNEEVEEVIKKYSFLLETDEAKKEIEAQIEKLSSDQMFNDLEMEIDQIERKLFSHPLQPLKALSIISISSDDETEQSHAHQLNYRHKDSIILPPHGPIGKGTQSLEVDEAAYVMGKNPLGAWKSCIIKEIDTSGSSFTVEFYGSDNSLQSMTISERHLAYQAPSRYRLPVATRCIAFFKQDSEDNGSFYSAIIAESPSEKNKNRYLVFLDSGSTTYLHHEELRVVVKASPDVLNDLPDQCKELTGLYLRDYRCRAMLRLEVGQQVQTRLNGEWLMARVLGVDASLVKLDFGLGNVEWLYRGSTRIKPIFAKAVRDTTREINGEPPLHIEMNNMDNEVNWETKGKIISEEINKERKPWESHSCNWKCSLDQYRDGDDKGTPLLLIPIKHGWVRKVYRYENEEGCVAYIAPCGRRLRNLDEVHLFLKLTDSQMEIDFFNYDWWVKVQDRFEEDRALVKLEDMSFGQEFVPVSLANSVDKQYPAFLQYSTVRLPQKNVNISVDREFMVCCNCEDDCNDKNKCSCWQLTIQSSNKGLDASIGYVHKRLPEVVTTGIYECNEGCKCKQTCINRVAQKPLRGQLQIFKTTKRGWGIRTLTDVPQGTFLCIYVGKLYEGKESTENAFENGDEYYADLDMIEVVEESKEGYESDVEDLNLDGKEYFASVRKCFGKDEDPFVMDAKTIGNIGRYLNHSCSPNVFVQNVFVDSHDLRFPWVAFFSSAFIKAGHELCWNYNYNVGSIEGRQIMCHCGANYCKGRLL